MPEASAVSDPVNAPEPPSDRTGARDYEIPRLGEEDLRLSGAASSLEDLLRTVERALAERDSTRLLELLVTDREFGEILFPSFPAAHPPINAPLETVWMLHVGDALRGWRKVMREYGGKDVRIHDIRFEKPDQDFVNFVAHETSRVDLEVDGVRRENVQLFGSVFHVGDQYKVLSYPD